MANWLSYGRHMIESHVNSCTLFFKKGNLSQQKYRGSLADTFKYASFSLALSDVVHLKSWQSIVDKQRVDELHACKHFKRT